MHYLVYIRYLWDRHYPQKWRILAFVKKADFVYAPAWVRHRQVFLLLLLKFTLRKVPYRKMLTCTSSYNKVIRHSNSNKGLISKGRLYRVSQKKLTPLLFIWISNVSVFFDSPCVYNCLYLFITLLQCPKKKKTIEITNNNLIVRIWMP
jgi:hypothetical protein